VYFFFTQISVSIVLSLTTSPSEREEKPSKQQSHPTKIFYLSLAPPSAKRTQTLSRCSFSQQMSAPSIRVRKGKIKNNHKAGYAPPALSTFLSSVSL
jgi:hypothetical protein